MRGYRSEKRLRHAHQRFVDGRVAVGMEAAHHVANDLRALAVLGVGREVLLPHRVEDAALDRLHAVAHVGQRARRDDRQGVVEVLLLRRLVERHDVLARAAAAAGSAGLRRPLGRRPVAAIPGCAGVDDIEE